MIERIAHFDFTLGDNYFLWGPRLTGKSTLLKELFPDSLKYDLLKADVFFRLNKNPEIIRQEISETGKPAEPIIIDEIQKIPELLDEIHWMIENLKINFILSGSSPRKIRRAGGNLLGGRAIKMNLHPLVFPEIKDFDLNRALNHGLIPKHYISEYPERLIQSYIGNYLTDEISQESIVRKIPAFSKFLEIAAFSNGEIVNYSNIARETGMSVPTIRDYFQIVNDTLIGYFVPSYQKKLKRRVVMAPKFYFFDLCIPNLLLKRKKIEKGTENFGKAFEHFIFMELLAKSHYSNTNFPISFWRTSTQYEVDFVIGDHEAAIEVKSTGCVESHHLKGIKMFLEDYKVHHAIIVSCDPKPRKIGNIHVLPWRVFLEKLWGDEIYAP